MNGNQCRRSPTACQPAANAATVGLLLAANLCVGSVTNGVAAKVQTPDPFPALLGEAKAAGIRLDGIQHPGAKNTLVAGDSVSLLLVQHRKGAPPNERLIHVQVDAPSPGELPSKPPPPFAIYSSLGSKLEFASTPTFVHLRTLGPFTDSGSHRKMPTRQDKSARCSLDGDFLSLGLDRLAAFIQRRDQLESQGRSQWSLAFGSSPFDAAEVARSQRENTSMQISPDDERAIAGSTLALSSYLQTIAQTPGLNKILFNVVDLPSGWSLLWHLGVNWDVNVGQDVAAVDGSIWGLPTGSRVYYLPAAVFANHHHALDVTLIVTSPRPPLLVCGGVIGLLAQNPSDANNYLTVRVADARQCDSPGEQ